jgi:hypothetical protein
MSVIEGQADPAIDVAAVQQAVDDGGTVVLRGTFSFEGVSQPGPDFPGPPITRVIIVTRDVVIRGEDATLVGGGSAAVGEFQSVLLVDAPGGDVTIQGIRFVGPHNAAVRVVASGDLRIQGCEVDGVIPTSITGPSGSVNGALGIHLIHGPFGAVTIRDNRIRMGGSAEDSTGGIGVVSSVASLEITGNRVSDTTAHGMNLQNVSGPARVERNVIVTGPVGRNGSEGSFVDAIRLLGRGEYRVLRNELDAGFLNAAVLRVAATDSAQVRQNEIVGSLAADDTPGAESAAIQVRGTAIRNDIRGNRIRGRGRVALSVVHSEFGPDRPTGTDGNPAGNSFRGNSFQTFDDTVAAVEVGAGARDTTIVGGSGILIDGGTNTVAQGDFQPPS